jgi:hypothetical protein
MALLPLMRAGIIAVVAMVIVALVGMSSLL